ncbi:hypothetical protein LARI1_G003574, partial [Lachnellula arida]
MYPLLKLIIAHTGPHQSFDSATLARRGELSKRCSDQVGLMKRDRHAMRKRNLAERSDGDGNTTYTITAAAPKYDFLKNDTCILTPEVSDGPYFFPRSQVLRQNIVENQVGVPLELDIGLIDVNTCEPLTDVLVDIWHCNATGSYSSFTDLDPNTSFGTLYHNLTGTYPNGTNGLGDLSWMHTDNATWLRGMWPTDKHGATSFQTIFPGFYIERAIHIHAQVHTNWSVLTNGSISHGRTVSTGQIFIDEALEQEIMAVEPYASHTQISRYTNAEDGIYSTESVTGAMTVLDTEPLDGVDYKNGVLGYITLGVDTTEIRDGSTVNA